MAHQHSRSQRSQLAARQRLEAVEARLNPPLREDEEVVDPFGSADGDASADAERLERLRLMFHWTPQRLH